MRRSRISERLRWVLTLVVLAMGTAACEEVVDPVLDTDRPFSLYGHIDPGAARQAIRVFPIEPVLQPTDETPLDAQLTLSGPGGETVAFTGAVIPFVDGTVGHVYHANFTPQFSATYRLTARDASGREAFVVVETPAKASLRLDQASGIRGNVRMPVAFENAEQVLTPEVVYTFESTRAPFSWTIPVSYEDDVVRSGNDWSVVVDLSRDIGTLYAVTGLKPGTDPIILNELRVQAFIATAEWTPPGGRFDAELLVQPGVFSNVENGFGFVGAGYVERATTLPPASVLQLAGFANQ